MENAELRSATIRAGEAREKTPTFFGLGELFLGLVVIVALWTLVVATIVAFDRVDRRAAGLLVPYLAWITFAAVLNFELWRLNA